MYNAKRIPLISLLVLAAASNAQVPTSAVAPQQTHQTSSAGAPSGRPDDGKGSIGSITDLARQLKIEQLKRDLREARREQGVSGPNIAARTPPFNVSPLEGMPTPVGVAPAVKPAPPVVVQSIAPMVTGILGLGGRLRARLVDGREVTTGQAVGEWMVLAISPAAVTFESCTGRATGAKRAQPATEAAACTKRVVTPTPV